MADWIEFDPSTFQKSDRQFQDGVEIIVGLSPYDLPEAVRGGYNEELGMFVIEFRYLGNGESRIPQGQDENVTFLVGEHSKRLYEIRVDVDGLRAKAVGLRVLIVDELNGAIDNLERGSTDRSRTRNYEVAKDVIAKNSEKLLAGV